MSRPAEHRELVITRLGVMAAVAVVLGVVIALLAIPFAGVAGIGARNIARGMTNLPAQLDYGDLSQRSRIVDAKGRVITTLYDENRITRPLSQISRTMVQAIVSIEDYRFYQHGAIDLKGTLRAFVTNQANSGVVQGGSSITQQLVKLTLQAQAQATGDAAQIKAVTADTYARKIQELRYAIALEQEHSKDWILERYLNTAYFGDGAFGVQAAAKHYFNVNSDKLSLTQAATLAGLVKNPTGYDPTNSPDRAVARRNVVLDRMAQLNVISTGDAKTAKASPLGLDVQAAQNGCVNSTAPFFCDYVIRRLLADPALGQTVEERRKLLNSGGLTIKTTLNPADQKAADRSTAAHVYATDQAIGAVAEVQPGTGNVLALSQSRPMGRSKHKGQTYLNYVVPKEYGDANGFQAGSTFKAFVLATAIRDGVGLNTTIDAQPHMFFPVEDYANCPGAPDFAGKPWEVHNSTTSGLKTLYTGTRQSVNTFFAQLEMVTGVCDPYNLAKSMGLYLTNPKKERLPAFTLGVVDVSPLEMAGAYATFGARGLYCDARPVTEIDDSAGNKIKTYAPSCKQVLPKEVADGVDDVLRGVQEPGGFGHDLGHTDLHEADGTLIPSAGKTGTTQDGKSVWFMGFTPQIATAAMIAGANSLGSPIPLGGQYIHGVYITDKAVSGSGFAGPMWADAMHAIQDSLKPIDFVKPPNSIINGKTVTVPNVGGLSINAAKSKLKRAGFGASVGAPTASGIPFGLVGGQFPLGHGPAHSVVILYPSTGHAPPHKHKKKKKGSDDGSSDTPGGGTTPTKPGKGH